MGELYDRAAWARVEVFTGAADAIWLSLATSAAVTDRGPGVSQGDAVQIAAELATLRDVVGAWGYTRIVAFPAPGATVDAKQTRYVEAFGRKEIDATSEAMVKAGLAPTFLVGDAPLFDVVHTGVSASPHAFWGPHLALAIDRILVRIGKSEQGPTEQAHITPGFLPAAVPLIIIVTGAALSIIGTIATWRYLDPDVRRDGLLVRQAAEDYAKRLTLYQTTGQMPPPSATETGAVDTVERLAKERSSTGWGMAAAVAGGIAVGTLTLGIIARRAA